MTTGMKARDSEGGKKRKPLFVRTYAVLDRRSFDGDNDVCTRGWPRDEIVLPELSHGEDNRFVKRFGLT
jgi:hypothetical protein